MTDSDKIRVAKKLLRLRALEAPLGFTNYRGVLTQKAIANVSGLLTNTVTKMAVKMDEEDES